MLTQAQADWLITRFRQDKFPIDNVRAYAPKLWDTMQAMFYDWAIVHAINWELSYQKVKLTTKAAIERSILERQQNPPTLN